MVGLCGFYLFGLTEVILSVFVFDTPFLENQFDLGILPATSEASVEEPCCRQIVGKLC
jgi:hypothetical protein